MDPDVNIHEIDLTGIVVPLGLLEMKQALTRLKQGECLRVTVDDPDIALSLQQLCRHSRDRLVDLKADGARIVLCFEKG